MITFSMFQEALSFKEPSLLQQTSQPTNRLVDGDANHLLKLLTMLPLQTQEQQAEHLENIVSVLRTANIEEWQRLKLMLAATDATDKLIATLRQQYIYETGALSDTQLAYVAEVKSLHYLIILAFNEVVRRQNLTASIRKKRPKRGLPRYFNTNKKQSNILATAIYQSLQRYHKLLCEDALCYQQPSDYLWYNINQLYHLSYQQRVSHIDLETHIVTPYTNNIHQLYCQICLHDLLNVRAMRRPNILLVQRLLPEWSQHIEASIEPTTETRVFVDLQSNQPPRYLTASSDINPYEDHYDCLFLELTPMVQYFDSRRQVSIEGSSGSSIGIGHGLLNTISMTIRYRYLQPQLTLPNKHSIKHHASLVTGFNSIYQRIGRSVSFASLIAAESLPLEERPRYDTLDSEKNSDNIPNVEVFGAHDSPSLFRIMRLASKANILNQEKVAEEGIKIDTVKAEPTAKLPLHIMSLFLLSQTEVAEQPDWSIGVVRWMHLDTQHKEVEWQLLSHQLVACGLRLEGEGKRSRHFVPALLLGKDERLQTISSLIIPSSYFQTNDRVVMRIDHKQTHLRLGRRLILTDEFSQYEIAQ